MFQNFSLCFSLFENIFILWTFNALGKQINLVKTNFKDWPKIYMFGHLSTYGKILRKASDTNQSLT